MQYPYHKGESMADIRKYTYLEKWDTKHGVQERVVIRDQNGKFVDSVNLTGLRKAKPVASR
jgi:hypothetical protein